MEAVLKMIYVPVDSNQHKVVVGTPCPICGEAGKISKGMMYCINHGWVELR
jgi:hypothetical protein